jgi:hypothetical protein
MACRASCPARCTRVRCPLVRACGALYSSPPPVYVARGFLKTHAGVISGSSDRAWGGALGTRLGACACPASFSRLSSLRKQHAEVYLHLHCGGGVCNRCAAFLSSLQSVVPAVVCCEIHTQRLWRGWLLSCLKSAESKLELLELLRSIGIHKEYSMGWNSRLAHPHTLTVWL